MTMLWVQLIGLVGVGLLLVMFQVNNRRTILRIQMASSLIMALHFTLLGATTGAAMNLLRVTRNFFFIKYRDRKWLLPVALAVFAAAGVLTWHDWTSILPVIGAAIGTTALWQNNPRYIRFLSILVPPFWFVYNFLHGSYAGMLGDTVTFSSVLTGIIRFDVIPKLRGVQTSLQTVEAPADKV